MRQRPLEYHDRSAPPRQWGFAGGALVNFLSFTLGCCLLFWAATFQRHATPLKLLLVLPAGVVALVLIGRATSYFLLRPLAMLIQEAVKRFSGPGTDYPCPVCGYDTRMTPNRCPECGTALQWGLWIKPTSGRRYRARVRRD